MIIVGRTIDSPFSNHVIIYRYLGKGGKNVCLWIIQEV